MRARARLSAFLLLPSLTACDSLLPGAGFEASDAVDTARVFLEAQKLDPRGFQALASTRTTVGLPEPKLVRIAELRVRVDAVEAAVRAATRIAAESGGLLASARVSQDDANRRDAQVNLRVPDDRFTQTLQALEALGDVRSKSSSTEDITRQYVDLGVRLAVKQETAQRLRHLLATRTGRLADVLEAERQLDRIVAEIEQLKGEQRYYDHQVALSSITVVLFEPGAGLQSRNAAPIREAFQASLNTLATSVAWLVYCTTFLVPWLLVAGVGRQVARFILPRRRAA